MRIHHFKLKDLDPKFFEQLKTQYSNDDMEITFWLKPKVTSSPSTPLTETKFWQLIESLNWEKIGHTNQVIEPLVIQLSTLSVAAIKKFEDILSEKLYLLDGKLYAQHTGKNAYKEGAYFSTDTFLYARCCVVANGQEFYNHVLRNPVDMPKNLTFSALLRVASDAYYLKTEKKLKYTPAYIYETFANSVAWDKENLIKKILDS